MPTLSHRSRSNAARICALTDTRALGNHSISLHTVRHDITGMLLSMPLRTIVGISSHVPRNPFLSADVEGCK